MELKTQQYDLKPGLTIWETDLTRIGYSEKQEQDTGFQNTYVDNLNRTLISYIDAVGDVQGRKTNVQADMTDWRVQSEGFRDLSHLGIEMAKYVALSKFNYVLKPRLHDLWGIRYSTGDHTKSHSHWPAIFSFTYYPDYSEEHPGLTFDEYDGMEYKLKPKHIYMWQGHHWHSVKTVKSEIPRYCIAGNITEIL